MYRNFYLTLWAVCILSAACIVGAGIVASDAMAAARPVALADASTPPNTLRYVMPGQHVTYPIQCANGSGFWSDVSAYRWNGKPLGAQRWSRSALRWVWDDPRGGRVTFDGITFRNRTRSPVLVAGWCES
jgi:hypothetical protein